MEIAFLIGLYLLIIGCLIWQSFLEKKKEKQRKDFEKEFKDILVELKKSFDKEKLSIDLETFVPYLVLIKEDCEVYNDEFYKTGQIISSGNFCSIVYEKDGFGKLLSGAGWIELDKTSKTFKKASIQEPIKLKQDTPVYNGPGKKYTLKGTLRQGTVIEVIGSFGNWKEILYKEVTGFIDKNLV